jgi:Flp pilus assembly CpaF family ATPase
MPDTETKGTDYVVFAANVGADGKVNDLSAIDDATAPNDIKAIKATVSGVAGDYVAIPVRNLKVRKLTVESEPKVVIS